VPDLQRYDATIDELVPVDQAWIDLAQKRLNQMASERVAADDTGRDRAPGNDQIATAYAVTVDGFISISHRAIRNPHSPFLVWMQESTWKMLANCATMQGQFYIPCTEIMDAPSVLRRIVHEMEKA
jgi:hypothetical protein